MTDLTVFCGEGWLPDGTRGPVYTSDMHSPAHSLKDLCVKLLETGWPASIRLRFEGCDREPCYLHELYKREFGKLPGQAFAKFQRDAKMREHMSSNRDPYRTGLPDAALGGSSDYGTTKRVGGDE